MTDCFCVCIKFYSLSNIMHQYLFSQPPGKKFKCNGLSHKHLSVFNSPALIFLTNKNSMFQLCQNNNISSEIKTYSLFSSQVVQQHLRAQLDAL